MAIKRHLQPIIKEKFSRGKAIIVIGPRQVGKTTVINELLSSKKYLFLNGDDPSIRSKLSDASTEDIKNIIDGYQFVFIDEAQRISGIGLTMKIITDLFPSVQLIANGSSAFELNQKINEPLTGRKWEYNMYPISWIEYSETVGYLKAEQDLENRLIYGMYPDVLNHPAEKKEVLGQLVSSYLFKDILSLGGINKPEILENLLKALAFQLGNEVSYNELAQLIGVDKNTVAKYISLLEKSFVIFRLGGMSRNLRNEIKRNQKIYFYDNGIRNYIIANLNPMSLRNDQGALWENFLISERMKSNEYNRKNCGTYFWRTKTQQEIDYIEEYDGKLFAYEFKWKENKKHKFPKSFLQAYEATVHQIHQGNYFSFLKNEV